MKETTDILELFKALNNHEVFTPPKIARDMISMLPEELWSDPGTRVLDPCVKSGVFLREIFYKLHEGLKDKGTHVGHDGTTYDLNDFQQRTNHILKNMLFGIATSELTGYVSRRTLYGVMEANSDKQIAAIDGYEKLDKFKNLSEDKKADAILRNTYNEYYDHKLFNTKEYECFEGEGNIFYPADEVSKKVDETGDYEFEDTYFPFIKDETKHKKICEIKEGKMKFDVIIGNPPYQLNIGNTTGNKSKARAIYHLFIDNAIKLNPKYFSMITPSRWMTGSGEGISEQWTSKMLKSNKFSEIHDFVDAQSCFPHVEIKGGVNYFLWESGFNGKCKYYSHSDNKSEVLIPFIDYLDSIDSGVLIRNTKSRSILEKIIDTEGAYYNNSDKTFSGIVSPKDFFTNKTNLTSSWDGFSGSKEEDKSIKLYLNKSIHKRSFGWIGPDDIPKNSKSIDLHKVYIPAAAGTGNDTRILGNPFYGEPGSVCSQTYLVIGHDPVKHKFSKKQCENIEVYIRSKFLRYLVSVKKKTQNGPRGVYQFVPIQDFNYQWDDLSLYKKYGLSASEIEHIETLISQLE
jgi:site-specific DNA-methyltransferase (adenine-specific)